MNIKKDTIEKYRLQVEELICQNKFKDALNLASRFPLKTNSDNGFVITKTRLLSQYKIKASDLSSLCFVEKDNPYYKVAPKMILFLEAEVKMKFQSS
jgi:hypothetical protein